ncbi:MAG: hypothetical protein EOO03_06940 [Chitinophagaceae bacterium]|nr:MAG: hypothetical protein EOO03_06940 [Chitinophagaceae bacterium]
MKHHVLQATSADLPIIYTLFEQAITFQKSNGYIGWESYDKEFVRADLKKRQVYKIVENDLIICIFIGAFIGAFIFSWHSMALP